MSQVYLVLEKGWDKINHFVKQENKLIQHLTKERDRNLHLESELANYQLQSPHNTEEDEDTKEYIKELEG